MEKVENNSIILVCTMNTNVQKIPKDSLYRRFPVVIEVPKLSDRPYSERLELIESILMNESKKVDKEIQINSELLRCFLLYPCKGNVLQLKNDIKIGCANAFVRELNRNTDILSVYVRDCHSYIRKAFLFYKENRDEIELLIKIN